jgi:GNAT superfamily N-acetyltransferase
MVIACLQGQMGEAFVAGHEGPRTAMDIGDDDPKAGLIISGDYSFFGGDPDSPDAGYLIENLFKMNQSISTVGIFADDKPGWADRLLSYPENSPVTIPRYRIVKKGGAFDENVLQGYIDTIPGGFALALFDKDIYNQAMQEDWSKEFCEIFESAEDYLNRGFGFVMLDNGKLVSGASTMTIFDGGAEVQVATKEAYRRKGLAMPCAARLIRECMKRNMHPYWDAANLVSKKMAVALGYEFKGEYTTIHMSNPHHTK